MLQANPVFQKLDAHRDVRDPRFDNFDESTLSDVIKAYLLPLPHVRTFGKYCGPGYGHVLARV
jgi:hypothetical protein